MAKAPKASPRKKTAPSKAADKPIEAVEDAVVIEETPPEKTEPVEPPAPTTAPDKDAGTEKAEDTPEPDRPEPPKHETVAKPNPPVAPKPVVTPSRGGAGAFIGLLLGGVAAAAIGFVAARYVVPEGWPFPGVPPEEDPVAVAVEAQGARIAGLTDRIDVLGGAVSTLEADTTLSTLQTDLTTRLDGLDTGLATMTTRLDEIDARLAAVEKLAPEGSAAAQMAAEAYERELAALREMFQAELTKVEAAQSDAATLEAQAAEAAKAAAGRAALARITAALDTGRPFDDALFDLTNSTGIDAPAALADLAAEGVPTLAALQQAFPAAARAGLDASVRAGVESGEVSRFTAFLQTQLGARSLEPKEGEDADAVLSRAEGALTQGDIAGALAELAAMPEAGVPALADWRTLAETRKAALEAGAALAQELNTK
jgi:hypothetical protein